MSVKSIKQSRPQHHDLAKLGDMLLADQDEICFITIPEGRKRRWWQAQIITTMKYHYNMKVTTEYQKRGEDKGFVVKRRL